MGIICYPCDPGGSDSWVDDGAEMTQLEMKACGKPPLQFRFGAGLPVVPVTGRMLIFGQGRVGGIMHEAEAISCAHGRMEHQKWILRADVTYTLAREGQSSVD